jgi:hypothetical protein
MEALVDHDELFELERYAVDAVEPLAEIDGEAVRRMKPKRRIVQEPPRRGEEISGQGRPHAFCDELFFRLDQEVLQMHRILAHVAAHPMGGHEDRDAWRNAAFEESPQLLLRHHVHFPILPLFVQEVKPRPGCRVVCSFDDAGEGECPKSPPMRPPNPPAWRAQEKV